MDPHTAISQALAYSVLDAVHADISARFGPAATGADVLAALRGRHAGYAATRALYEGATSALDLSPSFKHPGPRSDGWPTKDGRMAGE